MAPRFRSFGRRLTRRQSGTSWRRLTRRRRTPHRSRFVQVLPCGRREPLALGHCVSPTRRRCRLLLWRPRHRQRLGWSDPVDVPGSVSSVLFRVKQIQTGHEIVVRGLKRGGGALRRASAGSQGDCREIPKAPAARGRNRYYLGRSTLPRVRTPCLSMLRPRGPLALA
jgi:hypothetical protein